MALVVLQNLMSLTKKRGLHSEMSHASSQDTYQAISVKAEVLSDAEAEEDPDPVPFPGIIAEPEVSCVSVPMLRGFHRYGYPLFFELCCSEQLTFITNYFLNKRSTYRAWSCLEEADITTHLRLPPSQSLSTCLVMIIQNQPCSRCLHFVHK